MSAASVRPLLQGRRILVAEDEYMIAQEIADALAKAGADVLGPVPRVSDAMQVIAADYRVDGAVLDVNLYNDPIWPVVDVLLARNVPLVLATGYDASAIPPAYAHLPRREKPASGKTLTEALAHVLAIAASS